MKTKPSVNKLKTAPLDLENEARRSGYRFIGGIDEAGRGPLAGPVCAAVVIFDEGVSIPGVNDSKQIEESRREELYHLIMEKALSVGVGIACAEEIDSVNILRATKLACRRAIQNMKILPDYLLLDALTLEKCTIPQNPIVKGDARSLSIAAASIIAKVTRDRLMAQYREEFPMYGFERNKGYGTADHRKAIDSHGPSTLHRQSFLTPWFECRPPVRSVTCGNIISNLTESSPSNSRSIWAEIQKLSPFLPKCEIRELKNLYSTHCSPDLSPP